MHHPYDHPAAVPPSVMISGRALHTGAFSTVRATRRAEDGAGLRFLFPGFAAPLGARDLAALARAARRATVLTDAESGATIRTPEHLLAAALFFADAPLDVACDAEEIPGADGSAAPWFALLAEACAGAADHPKADASTPRKTCREYDCDLVWSHDGPEGRATAEPAPGFSVRYTLERGSFRESFALEDASDAPAAVLPARTFIFWSDWLRLRETAHAALLEGVDEESGLVLAESREEFDRALAEFPGGARNTFPLLHPRAFRLEAEAARHKVLDLLGDLALNGLALPRLRLTIANGGHALNHLLLDALRARGSGSADTPHEGNAS